MAAATRCEEAARAVNRLMRFSPEDQEALLEVIEDYFVLPSGSSDPDFEELSDEEGTLVTKNVKINITKSS